MGGESCDTEFAEKEFVVLTVIQDNDEPVNWCYVGVPWRGLANILQFALQNKVHDLNMVRTCFLFFIQKHPG